MSRVPEEYRDLRFKEGLEDIWTRLRQANKTIEDEKPWELYKKGETERLTQVLTTLVNDVIFLVNLASPVIPETAEKILDNLLAEKIVKCEPLFPRLEKN
jgi:methionyl-tRNA synthetase